jgi:hypothetical protein
MQIQVGSKCNLLMRRNDPVNGLMGTGAIESLNPAEMVHPFGFESAFELGHGNALIRVLTVEKPIIQNVVSTVLSWGLEKGELVTWRINYLTPLAMDGTQAPSSGIGRTFLTPAAKQRPGMPRKDRKLEPYKNILTSRLRPCPNL